MNTTLPQPHARLAGPRNWFIAAATAVVAIGGYTGIQSVATDTNAAKPAVDPSAAPTESGLGAALAVHYETTEVAAPVDGAGLGQALAVDWTVTPTYTVDSTLDVITGSVALDAGWAPIRYSRAPGLALIFSDLYTSQ